jgi:hypothetical protein
MQLEAKALAERISLAKKFLNGEMTSHKLMNGTPRLSRQELIYHLDKIHEVERQGLRNLGEMEFIRIERMLEALESGMLQGTPSNN